MLNRRAGNVLRHHRHRPFVFEISPRSYRKTSVPRWPMALSWSVLTRYSWAIVVDRWRLQHHSRLMWGETRVLGNCCYCLDIARLHIVVVVSDVLLTKRSSLAIFSLLFKPLWDVRCFSFSLRRVTTDTGLVSTNHFMYEQPFQRFNLAKFPCNLQQLQTSFKKLIEICVIERGKG